jgi:hypothetical protein
LHPTPKPDQKYKHKFLDEAKPKGYKKKNPSLTAYVLLKNLLENATSQGTN